MNYFVVFNIQKSCLKPIKMREFIQLSNSCHLYTEKKKLLNQQVSSAEIGTAVFFGNIYRFFCWIHRLFVNSTDEPVKSTDVSVRVADFKKKEKSVILTDISVDFTGSSVDFTNNL